MLTGPCSCRGPLPGHKLCPCKEGIERERQRLRGIGLPNIKYPKRGKVSGGGENKEDREELIRRDRMRRANELAFRLEHLGGGVWTDLHKDLVRLLKEIAEGK